MSPDRLEDSSNFVFVPQVWIGHKFDELLLTLLSIFQRSVGFECPPGTTETSGYLCMWVCEGTQN